MHLFHDREIGINVYQWKTLILMGALFATILYILQSKFNYKPSRKETQEKLRIPYAAGSLPFIGHGFELFKDVTRFLKTCNRKYGKVFKIKIFRTTMVIICDRDLASNFIKTSEHELSLYKFVERIYLSDAFSSDSKFPVEQVAYVIKKTVASKFDLFIPKIEEEANRMVQRLRKFIVHNENQKIDLANEMSRFVAATSTLCFVGVPLPDEIFKSLDEFMQLLNFIMNLTFIFPKSIIRYFMHSRLTKIRKTITNYFEPEIEKYLQDPNKSDSLILRELADSVHEDTGKKFNNEDIGNFIIAMLFVSTANTAVGATNVLVDLASNMCDWDRCKEDAKHYLVDQNNLQGLLASEFLNACVMETARMNSHPVSLTRAPTNLSTKLGDFYLDDDVNGIAVCSPMLQVHCASLDMFSNPDVYNPSRFLKTGSNEPTGPKSVMTWGAGLHLCPGKLFALYEIKIAVALFLLNFKFDIEKTNISTTEFSSSAFIEKKVWTSLQLI